MNNRTLGTIALVCAPALLVEGMLTTSGPNHIVTGIASMVFMFGWLCSNIAMQQMQALGTGMAAKIVLRVQMVGVILAWFFGFFEVTQLISQDNLIFVITDVCWPLSMILMIVVGIMAIRANRWAGWQRCVPLICALWLPVSMVIGLGMGDTPPLDLVATLIGFGWTAVAWFVLALVVRSNATLALPKQTPLPTAG